MRLKWEIEDKEKEKIESRQLREKPYEKISLKREKFKLNEEIRTKTKVTGKLKEEGI